MTDSGPLRVSVRPYEPADAGVTLTIFTDAITQTAAAHYRPEQIEAWARPGRRALADWDRERGERATVVAVLETEVVGFSDVDRDGWIDMLFVAPRYHRRGVARTLLGSIERGARAAGAAQLSADVSLPARPCFERIGFAVVREQRARAEGIALTNYRMVKELTASPSGR
ncbi:GNAT family N-acetyltransferase [Leucobacter sp. M11]|uniref:GNAT family N-acetyltransferase n=1 Tax=Leucobacter sp. M11 TaxID=2993565 RepID=UPI002D7E31DA|nr:GNAT family N-acetyltransferase [Leucobacter sp. M11]MEB4615729.1 GNAT family N-acetyltransferase [Leucobacter sp. M11]